MPQVYSDERYDKNPGGRSCDTCAFHESRLPGHSSKVMCKRHAPVILPENKWSHNEQVARGAIGVYPEMLADDFCGDWEWEGQT